MGNRVPYSTLQKFNITAKNQKRTFSETGQNFSNDCEKLSEAQDSEKNKNLKNPFFNTSGYNSESEEKFVTNDIKFTRILNTKKKAHRKKLIFKYRPLCDNINERPVTTEQENKKKIINNPKLKLNLKSIKSNETQQMQPILSEKRLFTEFTTKGKKLKKKINEQSGVKINWFCKPKKSYGQMAEQVRSFQIIVSDPSENSQTISQKNSPFEKPLSTKILENLPSHDSNKINLRIVKKANENPIHFLKSGSPIKARRSNIFGGSLRHSSKKVIAFGESPMHLNVKNNEFKVKLRRSGMLDFLALNHKNSLRTSKNNSISQSNTLLNQDDGIKRKNALSDEQFHKISVHKKPINTARENPQSNKHIRKSENIAISLNQKYKKRQLERRMAEDVSPRFNISPENLESHAEKRRFWAGENGKFEV